mmetsp:Transcript_2087/g.6298  ORF Transcript_2087/g.6298 Transcript_2087/m.6298 type:complete len:116 (+) Transcript_2087:1-348(+)
MILKVSSYVNCQTSTIRVATEEERNILGVLAGSKVTKVDDILFIHIPVRNQEPCSLGEPMTQVIECIKGTSQPMKGIDLKRSRKLFAVDDGTLGAVAVNTVAKYNNALDFSRRNP